MDRASNKMDINMMWFSGFLVGIGVTIVFVGLLLIIGCIKL